MIFKVFLFLVLEFYEYFLEISFRMGEVIDRKKNSDKKLEGVIRYRIFI